MNEINNTDLNLLKALKALLSERHVGRAAEVMNVTQSAMSHTLARLRIVFSDPLFIRTAKGLEPTKRALELSEPLDNALRGIQNLLLPPKLDLSELEARVCIQTHEFISATYLPKALSEINNKAPGIIFDLQEYNENSYKQLDSNEVDLVICSGMDAGGHLKQRLLFEEGLCHLLRSNHPALEQWSLKTFFSYPYLKLSTLKNENDPILKYAKQNKIKLPKIAMYTQTLSMQLYFLLESDAIAVVPESLAKIGVQYFGLVKKSCLFDTPKVSVKAIWHERNHNDPLHKWLRESIKSNDS